jgi:hypothetical protein
MNRMNFIRLGTGVSVVALVGALPGFLAVSADPLERWAARHKASVTVGKAGKKLVARPFLHEIGTALHELNDLADGPLMCQGNRVRGTLSGQRFQVELAAIS